MSGELRQDAIAASRPISPIPPSRPYASSWRISPLPHPRQLQPRGLVQRLDAQLVGFLGLRSRIRTDDDEVGGFGDGAGDLGAEGFGAGLGFGAAHALERAGDDHRLAGELAGAVAPLTILAYAIDARSYDGSI